MDEHADQSTVIDSPISKTDQQIEKINDKEIFLYQPWRMRNAVEPQQVPENINLQHGRSPDRLPLWVIEWLTLARDNLRMWFQWPIRLRLLWNISSESLLGKELSMSTRKIFYLGVILSVSLSSLPNCFAQAPTPGISGYTPINAEEIRGLAKRAFQNAREAGRLNKEDEDKFADINSESSLSKVEQTWASLESTAQEAKSKHLSIEHLRTLFSRRIDDLEKKKVISNSEAQWYRVRIEGQRRLEKQFTAGGKNLDFWNYCVLAIDLSTLKEKLNRKLAEYEGSLAYEDFDDLLLRSDMYLARNAVQARQLETFRSYISDPPELIKAKNELMLVLRDRANSRMSTPEVRNNLKSRLVRTQYESVGALPDEDQIEYAIKEVQRLIDSGIKNGNIGHQDATRLQQELELVKAIKKAYPGPLPGVDPFERELRVEEVRFMTSDIRFLQDWLAQLLRNDGDASQARQEMLIALRRANLAYFSGRISKWDASAVLSNIYASLKASDNPQEQLVAARNTQGLLDMMIADYSWRPVDVATRVSEVGALISKLKSPSGPENEKARIEGMLQGLPQSNNPEKIGAFIVAGTELEMLRNKVRSLLKEEQTRTTAQAED